VARGIKEGMDVLTELSSKEQEIVEKNKTFLTFFLKTIVKIKKKKKKKKSINVDSI
jgi:hypothetical protein